MQAKAARTSVAPDPTVDLRRALAQFATGVTIVTTRTPDGTPVGMTANSFSSVSLEPPLVLWSVSRKASSCEAFRMCERYAVHVLALDQLALAKRFATRGADKFGPGDWRESDSGLPRFDGCVAWFECANRAQHPEGDHIILVGRIEAFELRAGPPLIFHDSRYVAKLDEAPLPPVLRSPWS